MTDLLDALREAGIRRAAAGEPMTRHTGWRIGGPADYLCVAEDKSQLLAAIAAAREYRVPWLVLGGGNNILVSDDGIEGLVIVNRLRGTRIEEENHQPVLRCGAGVFFARAAQYSAQRGYSGMEWGIAVPGTVGGGVVNNAGAHSSDVSRSLVSATVVDPAGVCEVVPAGDLAYRYRQSALKTPYTTQSRLVVTGCTFRLEPGAPEDALARIEELRRHRLRTQPIKEASAGSTFKNPDDGHAGALVDGVGLKGHRIGQAQISPLHANFILNLGGASAGDVIALIELARNRVLAERGIRLEPEVQFVGRWPRDMLHRVLGDAQ